MIALAVDRRAVLARLGCRLCWVATATDPTAETPQRRTRRLDARGCRHCGLLLCPEHQKQHLDGMLTRWPPPPGTVFR